MQNENTGKIFITEIKHSKKRVLLELSNEESIEINEDIVLDYYLFCGKEVSQDELKNIKKSANMAKALQKAYSLLSQRMYTQKEIENKLFNLHFDKVIIDNVIKKLKELKYIDDNAYVEEYLNMASYKNYGANRIKKTLIEKGIDRKLVEQINFNDDEQIQIIENQMKYLLKKYEKSNYKKAYQQIYNRLINLGFDNDLIKSCLSNHLKYSKNQEQNLIQKDIKKGYDKYYKKNEGYKLKQSIISYLLQKGYNYDVIMEELEEFDKNED